MFLLIASCGKSDDSKDNINPDSRIMSTHNITGFWTPVGETSLIVEQITNQYIYVCGKDSSGKMMEKVPQTSINIQNNSFDLKDIENNVLRFTYNADTETMTTAGQDNSVDFKRAKNSLIQSLKDVGCKF